jgi:hypothetical protein
MINVPHAFTPEYPADETRSRPCKVPVILNVYDAYMFGANAGDLLVDVEAAFPKICELTWCHQSQLTEWLPWVGRHNLTVPRSLDEWARLLRERFARKSRELGLADGRAVEAFTVTAWGEVPACEPLLADLPALVSSPAQLASLRARLDRWRGR